MTKWMGALAGTAATVTIVAIGYVRLLDNDADRTPALGDTLVVAAPEPAAQPDMGVGKPKEDAAANANASSVSDPVAPVAEAARIQVPEILPPLAPPEFDLIRVERDGATLVAGHGAPKSKITVFLENREIATTFAGDDGKFASLMSIFPSSQPRRMTLLMQSGGKKIFSETEIIVAPFAPEPKSKPETVSEPEPISNIASNTGPTDEALPEGVRQADTAAAISERTALLTGGDGANEAVPPLSDAEISGHGDAQGNATTPLLPGAAKTQAERPPAQKAQTPEAQTPEAQTPEAPDQTPASQLNNTEVPASQGTAALTSGSDVEERAVAPTALAPPSDRPDIPEKARILADTRGQTTFPKMGKAGRPLQAQPKAGQAPLRPATAEALPNGDAPTALDSPPQLLAIDARGVRPLPGRDFLDRVAIDTISYDDAGDVALAGRGKGAGAGFVRIYLDNKPITTSRISPDGSWRVKLPEIDKGVYALRVDQVDASGIVTSRAQTPFEREDRESLAAAAERAKAGPVHIVTVQPGNTLWQIARDRYGLGILYVRVFDANKGQIRDPDLIYPGQIFDLPQGQSSAFETAGDKGKIR